LNDTEEAWTSGNIFDGLTAHTKVTFLNGLTRCQAGLQSKQDSARETTFLKTSLCQVGSPRSAAQLPS
jgi:hypothetical protein